MILWLLACTGELIDGEQLERAFLIEASEVVSPLDIDCAEVTGGDGPFDVLLDDYTGHTVLLERGTDSVWLRDPFGIVSDRCWWLPLGERGDPDIPCADDEGIQTGTCPARPVASGEWLWQSPGHVNREVADADAVVLDGTLLTWGRTGLARLDLTPSDDKPIDAAETGRTYRTWLPTLQTEGAAPGTLAVGKRAVVGLAEGELTVWRRPDVLRGLDEAVTRTAPAEATHVAAAADTAVVAGPGVIAFYRDLGGDALRSTRRHAAVEEVIDLALDPLAETAWVAQADSVLRIGRSGDVLRYPTPGVEGVFLGRPQGQFRVYAWGNDDDTGRIWRLEPDGTAVAHPLSARLLGAGTGETFQELVVVEASEGAPVVRGLLDPLHLAGQRLELAMAAFVESPRDPDRLSVPVADEVLDLLGDCGEPVGVDEEIWSICCAQSRRAEWLQTQLDALSPTLDQSALVLGVNPTVLGLSEWCEAQGIDSGQLPEVLGTFFEAHPQQVSAAIQLHSTPLTELSGWVACPRDADPDEDCFTDESVGDFYAALVSHASLAAWGEAEPDWWMLGGGYEGANAAADGGGESWTTLYPATPLPDGDVPEALYFGLLAMNPQTAEPAAKELAPADARLRAGPVPVGANAGEWDEGESALVDYRPGTSFASTWLYEIRRSGLLFADFVSLADPDSDWSDPSFRGDEDEQVINHADLALQEHYWMTRVLAHRGGGQRWWWWHLQDLSRPRSAGLDDGWIDCVDTGCTTTELDLLLERVDAQAPVITWSARPSAP